MRADLKLLVVLGSIGILAKRLHLLAALGALVVSALFSSCKPNESRHPARMKASEEHETNLGRIYESEGLDEFTLVLTNDTDLPIVPLGTYTHCSCLKAEVEREPVMPGEEFEVRVTYNPAYRSGPLMEEIQVF